MQVFQENFCKFVELKINDESDMKRFIAIFIAAVLMGTLASCDPSGVGDRNTDTEVVRPGNGNENDNGSTGGGNQGGETVDRSNYEVLNMTYTQAIADFYGQYYEGQPADVGNWYIILADDEYDLETYEGTGDNIVLELFAKGNYADGIPVGEYSVEAFLEKEFADKSVLYAWEEEETEDGEAYMAAYGTWLYAGNETRAGATAGTVTVSRTGGSYTISYNLHDDEYQISFAGSYTGYVDLYDASEETLSSTMAKSQRRNARR